jgi:hypothetical protein
VCPQSTHLELGGQQLEDVIDLVLETAREHLIGLVQGEHLDVVWAKKQQQQRSGQNMQGGNRAVPT